MAPMLLDLLDMLAVPTLLNVTLSPHSRWTCVPVIKAANGPQLSKDAMWCGKEFQFSTYERIESGSVRTNVRGWIDGWCLDGSMDGAWILYKPLSHYPYDLWLCSLQRFLGQHVLQNGHLGEVAQRRVHFANGGLVIPPGPALSAHSNRDFLIIRLTLIT